LGAAYMNLESFADNDGITKALFVTPEMRYILDEDKNGYSFIGFFGRYIMMQYQQTDYYNYYSPLTGLYQNDVQTATSKYHSIGAGIVFGYKYIFRNRICIELFGGPVYSGIIKSSNGFYNMKDEDLTIDQDIPHALLKRYSARAGITAGFLF
jgi:small nuclear ribonucleoprotein (snRNP)-like protein